MAMLLIKPCNISPRLLFVPATQLMSPILSQQETKDQRTLCSLTGLGPLVETAARLDSQCRAEKDQNMQQRITAILENRRRNKCSPEIKLIKKN